MSDAEFMTEMPKERAWKGSDLFRITGMALGFFFLGILFLILTVVPKLGGPEEMTRSLPFFVGLVAMEAVAVVGAVSEGLRHRGLDWSDLGLKATSRRSLLIGAGWGAVLQGAFTLLSSVAKVDNPQLAFLAPENFTPVAAVGMLLATGLAIPFAEEVYFRGFLHDWLRERWGVRAAVFGGSAAFGLIHGIPVVIVATLLLGVVLALLRERSGSLWPSVVAHATFNSVAMILLYGDILSRR